MIDVALLFVAKAMLGWLLADLVGGLLHWLEDRVLTESTPLIGELIVKPNRRHHAEPMAFTAGGVLARNATTWAAAGIVSAAWLTIAGPSVVWAFATLGGIFSSSVHYATHVPARAPRWIRVLQEVGVVQSVGHHAAHHRPPSDRRYCVLTNWINPVLDAIGLWSGLERVLRVAGIDVEARR